MQTRHPNGGGYVRGAQAIVSPSAFVGPEASVFHGAHVTGLSRLVGQTGVGGTAIVHHSFVADSVIGKVLPAGETYTVGGQPFQPTFPFVANANITARSKIENHLVAGDPRFNLTIINSWLEDASEVRDRAHLEHVHLLHYATVCEEARVIGTAEETIHLGSRYHVHRGEWNVAPSYFEVGGPFDDDGIHVGVTECTYGNVNVGCWCVNAAKLVKAIRRHGPDWRIARRYGWKMNHLNQLTEGLQAWETDSH